MKRVVYLVSTSSPLAFPGNTASHFTNELPDPIEVARGTDNDLYARVSHMVLPNWLEEGTQVPGGFLKIHLGELLSQTRDRQYEQVAATIKYPPDFQEEGDYMSRTMRHTPYLALRFSRVNSLHVRVTDIYDREVRFKRGLKTVLTLEMTTAPDELQFTVVCTSGHLDSHPNNRLSHFKAALPQQMTLPQHEVALLQLMYPSRLEHDIPPIWFGINGNRHYLEVKQWHSSAKFLLWVRAGIRNTAGARRELSFAINAEQGRAYFKRSQTANGDAPSTWNCKLEISEQFARLCGERGRMPGEINVKPGQTVMLPGRPDVVNVLPSPFALVHCDILEANVLGSSRAQVLQCVPLLMRGQRQGDLVGVYEPKQLTYHAVRPHPFQFIDFKFTEPDGTLKEYRKERDSDVMMVTLVFRRRRN